MEGITIVLGDLGIESIADLEKTVPHHSIGTPVLVVSGMAWYGWVTGVRLDTGRRGRILTDGTYVPDPGDSRGHRADDVAPNVVSYVVRGDREGEGEFVVPPERVRTRPI